MKIKHHLLSFGTLVLFLFLFPAAQSAAASAHTDPKARLEFPVTINGFRFVGKKRFRNPAVGYMLRYVDRGGITVDLFVYDLGLPNIKNGVADPNVVKQKKQAMGDIYTALRYGMYRKVKQAKTPGSFPPGFLSASYRITDRRGNIRRSHLFIRGQNRHFVKLRASGPDAGSTDARIAGFARQLLPLVTRAAR